MNETAMKTLVVIPARYASSRFPGKPLALLAGKPIVDYAYSVALDARVARAVVATDDERIREHMELAFGPDSVMMTSDSHRSGTDRCGEVVRRLAERGQHFDAVVNLQGDEPFAEPAQIQALVQRMALGLTDIATLRTPITSLAELLSPDNVKVVCADSGQALYFSRQPLPYRRGVQPERWLDGTPYYKHVGIYAFRTPVLEAVCRLPQGFLEECEKLEQLRWLAAGYRIDVVDTAHANIGIDTPADLAAAERSLAARRQSTNDRTKESK